MCNYVLKQLMLYQALVQTMFVWTYCSERFVEISEVRFTFKMPSSWTKTLEVKLGNKK